MSLGIRKLLVVGLVLAIVGIANVMIIAAWLQDTGLIDLARHVRREFLTGTAITILVALLILLAAPASGESRGCSGVAATCAATAASGDGIAANAAAGVEAGRRWRESSPRGHVRTRCVRVQCAADRKPAMTFKDQLDIPAIEAFCRRWRITELSVFGSAVRGELRPDSDVDVLVSFEPDAPWSLWDLVDMEEELAGIVGRKIDLLTRDGVERSRNWIRRKAILETVEPIYRAA